mmetsp:Transcript_23638/g.52414  ORF Transcript_23638/g.52414 Transcript_23638/m.52414 type:complete len:212 (+) Transcript_23638:683-1318(+)
MHKVHFAGRRLPSVSCPMWVAVPHSNSTALPCRRVKEVTDRCGASKHSVGGLPCLVPFEKVLGRRLAPAGRAAPRCKVYPSLDEEDLVVTFRALTQKVATAVRIIQIQPSRGHEESLMQWVPALAETVPVLRHIRQVRPEGAKGDREVTFGFVQVSYEPEKAGQEDAEVAARQSKLCEHLLQLFLHIPSLKLTTALKSPQIFQDAVPRGMA